MHRLQQKPINGHRRSKWPYLSSVTPTLCLRVDSRVSPGRQGFVDKEETATRVKPGTGACLWGIVDRRQIRGFLWPGDFQMAPSFSLPMGTSIGSTSRRTSVAVVPWLCPRVPLLNSLLGTATSSNGKRRCRLVVARKRRIETGKLFTMSSAGEGQLTCREGQGQGQGTRLETGDLEAVEGT